MPRYEDHDWEERHYSKGGQYQSNEPYLTSNLYNQSGRSDLGLDGGGTRLYIGRLSSRTRSQDLEDLFSKYGRLIGFKSGLEGFGERSIVKLFALSLQRVRDVDMKHNFAFVEFLDIRDADDARYYTNGKDLDGSRLIVEFARRGPRGLGGGREYLGSGPTPGTGRCYNCGNEGHWARDCKAGDWRDKCYRCSQRGHIERNCQNSPTFNNSLSRSRSRSPRGHGKPQKYFFQSQSRSYSTSPVRKDHNSIKESRKRSLKSKSKSLTPPPKEILSISTSPQGVNASASQSPKSLQAKENLIVQESQQDLSRSTSHSPTMDMEKMSPHKGDSERSRIFEEE